MPYRYELHAHTFPVSPCASTTPAQLVDLHLDAHYDGVVITDHFGDYSLDVCKDLPWHQKMDYFLSGYRKARDAAGERLQVLLGMEIRFPQNCNDYLVYGMEEAFLYDHPELLTLSIAQFSKLAHENGLLVYQAHPFRNGMTVVDPRLLDGIETFNGNPHHDSRNDAAQLWAQKFGLLCVSGSDYHEEVGVGMGGLVTAQRIEGAKGLVCTLSTPDGVDSHGVDNEKPQ